MAQKPALGLLLPIENGSMGYFNMGFDAQTQVKSNIINLILTRKGERLMNPNFGCDVQLYIFEPLTDDTVANIQGSIQEALSLWIPQIKVNQILVTRNQDFNTTTVSITYTLNKVVSFVDTVSVTF